MATLLLPVVLEPSAASPVAMLSLPVVLMISARGAGGDVVAAGRCWMRARGAGGDVHVAVGVVDERASAGRDVGAAGGVLRAGGVAARRVTGLPVVSLKSASVPTATLSSPVVTFGITIGPEADVVVAGAKGPERKPPAAALPLLSK